MRAFFLAALALVGEAHGYVASVGRAARAHRGAPLVAAPLAAAPFAPRGGLSFASMALPSDDELFSSLRARVSQSEGKSGPPPPLGPDEVGAECMGPADVVEYCMKSLLAQASDGCSTDGCRTMLSFAVKADDKAEDFVGQLQPGYFSDPRAFMNYIAAQPRYETLTRLDEYKCMGTPDFSDMARKAVQKLLVRRDGANWEDLMINMAMVEVAPSVDELPPDATATASAPSAFKKRRWLITSIYKQAAAA